jgi:hypothetical protein
MAHVQVDGVHAVLRVDGMLYMLQVYLERERERGRERARR